MSTKSLFTLLIAASLLIVSGCQSMEKHDESDSMSSAAPATGPAIACDECKTTFTSVPVMSGNPRTRSVVGYRTVSKHECPECRNVATEMLQAGKSTTPGAVVHKCKICGGTMTVCHVE